MKRILLIITLLYSSAFAFGQLWNPICNSVSATGGANDPFQLSTPAAACIDWSKAGLQSVGGIPSGNWTQYGSTLTPIGGGSDDTTQINTALTACGNNPTAVYSGSGVSSSSGVLADGAKNFTTITDGVTYVNVTAGSGITTGKYLVTAHTATTLTLRNFGTGTGISYSVYNGQYVLLGAGTFQVNGTVYTSSYCVLRGTVVSGPNASILNVGGTSGNVLTTGADGDLVGTFSSNITSGYGVGSTSLTVGSLTGITQAAINNRTQYVVISERNLYPSVSYTGSEGSASGGFCVSSWDGANNGHGRVRCQIAEVTAISGSTITIDPPLYTDYKHSLPTWTSTTNYACFSFITNGGHTYRQTACSNPTPFVCVTGGSSPAFSTSGGSVTDGTCTWLDIGIGTDTNPQIVPFNEKIFAGVETVQVYANKTRVNGANFNSNLCAYCWFHEVEGNFADANQAQWMYTFRNQLSNSYISNAYPHTAGNTDGVQLRAAVTATLIQNNIFERLHTGLAILEWGSNGNVIAYNYALGNFHQNVGVVLASIDTHAPHPQFNLSEGNVVNSIDYDSVWGGEFGFTSFRDWLQGTTKICSPNTSSLTRSTAVCDPLGYYQQSGTNSFYGPQQAQAAIVSFLAYHNNFFGTVIGSNQAQTVISPNTKVLPDSTNTAIPQSKFLGTAADWTNGGACRSAGGTNLSCRTYQAFYDMTFGFSESADGGTFALDGPTAYNTGYLYKVYSQYFNGTTVSTSTNCTSTCTTTMPSSFYLSAKPSWWPSGPTWPAIGVDVTTGDTVGNHAYSTSSNAAMNCYLGRMGGSDGGNLSPLTTFDPVACYDSPAPPPPFNVTIACTGSANGTVTGNDTGHGGSVNMSCTCTAGTASGTCSVAHAQGDNPTYTQNATTGAFLGWTGDCTGSGTCSPTVGTLPLNISANFSLVPTIALTCPNGCATNFGIGISLTIATTNVASAAGSSWTLYNPDGSTLATCGYNDGSGCSLSGVTKVFTVAQSGTYSLQAISGGIPAAPASVAIVPGAVMKGFAQGGTTGN